MEEMIDLLMDLLNIYSPSGSEEKLGDFLVSRLSVNFDVKKQFVGEKRFNIIAKKGIPKIIFNVHFDTVPENLPVIYDKDSKSVYGRGAVDAKGPLASLILACEKAAKEGYSDFGIYLDVGEELDFSGIKELMKLDLKPELVIICEPTSMNLRVAQKGLVEFTLKSYGKSAHGAHPEDGFCAISNLIETIQKIKKINRISDDVFGKGTLNIGLIKGGSAINVVPDFAESKISIRTVKKEENILKKIKKIIPENIELQEICEFEPYILDNKKIISHLSRILNNLKIEHEVIAKPGFTEMYFWKDKGPSIVIGPGDDKTEHSSSEHITLDQLKKGCDFYLNVIKKGYNFS